MHDTALDFSHVLSQRVFCMKLTTVSKRIASQGLSWTAGETSRSSLSPKELASGSSGSNVSKEMKATSKQMIAHSNALQEMIDQATGVKTPAQCDWLPFITLPKDQGTTCNSCTAFSVVATIEARMNIQTGQQPGAVNLSEGYVFFKGCGSCCKNGWQTPSAISFCITDGVPSEESFPYNPAGSPTPNPIQPVIKLIRSSKIANDPEIRRILCTKGPIVGDMDLYSDFAHYTGGVYKPASANPIGTHSVCIVGFDDNPTGEPPYWLCKNSWGTDWGFNPSTGEVGQGGFFKLAQGAAGLATSYVVYDIDIQVLLSFVDAKAAIESIRDTTISNPSFRGCLKQILKPGFPPKPCTVAQRDVANLAKDLCTAYPTLRPILDPVLT